MKLDRLSYLELVVYHVDATFYDFPSRCCIVRIPLDRIDFNCPSSVFPIGFSLGQLRKLNSIGLFNNPDLYKVVGHRPFDKHLIDRQFSVLETKFRDTAIKAYNCYYKYLKNIGSTYFEQKDF